MNFNGANGALTMHGTVHQVPVPECGAFVQLYGFGAVQQATCRQQYQLSQMQYPNSLLLLTALAVSSVMCSRISQFCFLPLNALKFASSLRHSEGDAKDSMVRSISNTSIAIVCSSLRHTSGARMCCPFAGGTILLAPVWRVSFVWRKCANQRDINQQEQTIKA